MQFQAQAAELRRSHTPIVVDGLCASACTILVDEDRSQVCITRKAVFAYHMVRRIDADLEQPRGVPLVPASDYSAHSYATPGLNAWIKAKGGLPREGVLVMRFDEAKAFYRPCDPKEK